MTDETNTPQWEIRTLANAYEQRDPTEYIVDKYFATYTLNIVYGSPGSMKSMMLADLCAHVASGTKWLPCGSGGIECKQSPVLWVDMDNGGRRTDGRFDAIGKANALPVDAPLYYVSMPNPSLIAHDLDSMLMLKGYIMQLGAKFIVIDNLGLITGDVEENGAGMAQIMGNLRTLAERTGAAIVLVHHQRKGGAAGGRAGDALRGHSSIEAAIDLAIHITREQNTDQITLRSTKTRDVPVPTATANFSYEHKPGTNDLYKAWFDGLAKRGGENPIRDEILSIVEFYENGIGKGKLMEMVRDNLGEEAPGVNKIRAEIDHMLAVSKEIEEVKQGPSKFIRMTE